MVWEVTGKNKWIVRKWHAGKCRHFTWNINMWKWHHKSRGVWCAASQTAVFKHYLSLARPRKPRLSAGWQRPFVRIIRVTFICHSPGKVRRRKIISARAAPGSLPRISKYSTSRRKYITRKKGTSVLIVLMLHPRNRWSIVVGFFPQPFPISFTGAKNSRADASAEKLADLQKLISHKKKKSKKFFNN